MAVAHIYVDDWSPVDLVLPVAVYVVAINLAAFGAFAWDKHRAQTGGWRVPEARLLQLAMIGGTIGAMGASRWLRHKTFKEPFRTYLRAIAVVQVLAIIAGLALWAWSATH